MNYIIDIDAQKCTGCRSCTITCSVIQEQVANPVLGRIQVARFEADGVHIPIVCQQCEDAPCVEVCPMEALIRDAGSNVISIDYERCIGCRYCVLVCPFGAMLIDPKTQKVFKCNHCDGDPVCVKVCYTQAIQYVPVNRSLYNRRIAAAEKLRQIMETRPAPSLT